MVVEFSNIASILIYLGILSLSALLIHFGQSKSLRTWKKWALRVAGLGLPVVLAALRHGVGADFFSYASKIEYGTTVGLFEFSSKFNNMEPSVWILGNISEFIFGNSMLFFLVNSLLTVLFFYLGMRNFGVKRMGLAILLIFLVVFPQSLSGVRQGVAMAMSFYAFSLVPQGRLKRYIITIVTAGVFFHFTALAMLVVYPLYIWTIKKSVNTAVYIKKVVTLVIASPLIIILGLYVIQFIPILNKYTSYYTNFLDHYADKIGTQNILPEVFALIFMLIVSKIVVARSNVRLFVLLTTIIMFIISLTSYFMPLTGRFADYFMPMFLMMFASTPDLFKKLSYERIATVAVIIWGVAFFIGAFYITGSGSIFPYQVKLGVI